MNNFAEKRKHQRKDARWPVVLTSNTDRIRGETRNISGGGVCICCENPLEFGKSYFLSFTTDSERQIETTIIVVWSDLYCIYKGERGWGMGGRFTAIAEEDVRYLDAWAASQEA